MCDKLIHFAQLGNRKFYTLYKIIGLLRRFAPRNDGLCALFNCPSKSLLLAPALFFYAATLQAQQPPFTDISASLVGVSSSSVAWGDFDNDGDLDILLTGFDSGKWNAKVYRNEAGSFVEVNAGLTPIVEGEAAWGDYDNDGDLDIALTGRDIGSRRLAKIYRNEGQTFVDIQAGLTGVSSSAVAWGDYDNDGDADVLFAGYDGRNPLTKIYRNDFRQTGTFTALNAMLIGIEDGAAAWGDYDGDGDRDILLAGSTGGSNAAKIYRNEQGSFVDAGAGLTGVENCAIAWGDYDNDGDLDILLTGRDNNFDYVTKIYRNNSGNFVELNADLPGVYESAAAWGDYDNDGDLDILLAGRTSSPDITKIFRNDGGSFVDIQAALPGTAEGAAAWGDYDNDGDLDFLLAGNSSSTKIFRNNIAQPNVKPVSPAQLSTTVLRGAVLFTWNPATDNETPAVALTHNLRIGSSPQGAEIMSPLANAATGFRRVAARGNTDHRTSWKIDGLPKGTYYWSVQAIDHGLAGSAFAPEQTFAIVAPAPPQNLAALAGVGQVTLQWRKVNDLEVARYFIYGGTSSAPEARIDFTNSANDTAKTIAGLKSGVKYYFRVTAVDGANRESDYSNEVSAAPLSFSNIAAPLPAVSHGATAWGDYDNDGDLDVVLTGFTTIGEFDIPHDPIAKIYRNDGQTWADINAPLSAAGWSAVAWGDYDNDGDLDILLAGWNGRALAKIYHNDRGQFVDLNANLNGAYFGSAAWGDYDNDGDLDALLAGDPFNGGAETTLYRNDRGRFIDSKAELEGIAYGAVAWGDYDNDSDLDILLTGRSPSLNFVTKVYRNESGKFVDSEAGLLGLAFGAAAWGDYDNDGDLDILAAGYSGQDAAMIYRNDAGKFAAANIVFAGVSNSAVAWGDYDNDGDLDALLTGSAGAFPNRFNLTKVYRNEGASFIDINAELAPVDHSAVAWGDYDNDRDLDLLLLGRNDQNQPFSAIYRNNVEKPNTAPAAPANLTAAVNGEAATLNWQAARDAETNSNGLTYNLRMGKTPGGLEVVSPMAETATGYRKIVALGNANHQTRGIIKSLPDGTYYWSVQTVDHSFAGSAFAAERSFVIAAPAPPFGLEVAAAPGQVTLRWRPNSEADFLRYRIYMGNSPRPTGLIDSTSSRTDTTKALFNLANNTAYYFRITAVDSSFNQSGFSNEVSATPELFTNLPGILPVLAGGTANWGDFDNDGDLDLLLTGREANLTYSKILRNDNGVFNEAPANLVGVYNSAVEWGDYDNDGDLDILLAGSNQQHQDFTPVAKVYRNDTGSFIDIRAALAGVSWCTAAWGDYNSDGDLDIALAGLTGANNSVAKIYRNDNGSFVDIQAGLAQASRGALAWSDYDNDGDLDLLLTGSPGSFQNIEPLAKIYRNETGVFVDANAALSGVYNSAAAWGDYDQDGDADVVVAGRASAANSTKIYRNDEGRLLEISANLPGLSFSSVAWGDYDNDGDLDLLLMGLQDSFQPVTRVYANEAGSFRDIDGNLGRIASSDVDPGRTAAWADFDNDGDLEIFLNGANDFGGRAVAIYRNNHPVPNTTPTAPSNLSATAGSNAVTFKWNPSSDAETAQKALAYNLRIGATPAGVQRLAPMANVTTGYRRVVRVGNAGQVMSRALSNLPPGNYFWSVQAIDHAFAGSTFAPESIFTVSVPSNRPPVVANALPDLTLNDNANPFLLSLNGVFFDQDNDALAYTALTEPADKVSANVAGTNLILTPLRSGLATVTVTALDARGGQAADNFQVRVNGSPQVVNSISDATLTIGVTQLIRDLEGANPVFSDPDGDKLNYVARSRNPVIATTEIQNTLLTVTPRLAGNTIVEVTAEDSSGGQRTISFIVTTNRAPRLSAPLTDFSLIFSGMPFRRNLEAEPKVFVDDDGNKLNYSVTSSVPSLCLATIESDTVLVVTPVGSSEIRIVALITVRADDSRGGVNTTGFMAAVAPNQPPRLLALRHDPALPQSVSLRAMSVEIVAKIEDDTGIDSAVVKYSRGGERSFQTLLLSAQGDSFTAVIRGNEVTSRGLEYFIVVRDRGGLEIRSPASGVYAIQVDLPEGVLNNLAQPAGSDQNAYRLVSWPLQLKNPSPAAVLEGELGKYKNTSWRFYGIGANEEYVEYPGLTALESGKAYWLIVKESGKRLNTGAAVTFRTDTVFAVSLHAGWNFVGNPFHFTVPWENLRFRNAGPTVVLRAFSGRWNDSVLEPIAAIMPFAGYAVFAAQSDLLLIDPDLSPPGGALAKSFASFHETETRWHVQITAQAQAAQDVDNFAMINSRASSAWDAIDQPEPPVIGEFVSVYFPHREWNTLAKTYCLDARPEPSEGEVWDFEVKTNIRDKVNLSFQGLKSVPEEFEVWLVDETMNLTRNLRKSNLYTVAGSERPKQLKLVVGKRDFINGKLASMQKMPVSYELTQNFPNPFNPVTAIRYGLPQAERVTLRIYNLLAEEVVTLMNDEFQAAGYHVAIWDGRNKLGKVVGSGIYIYRFRAGNFTSIKKMALVK